MKNRRGRGRPPRRRGRPAGKPLSRRELAARRANLAQARRAPKDVIYRPTEKRRAASLKNLREAMAARRSEEASDRLRLNALKHGVYSREMIDESVRRLGESEREFAEHRELFARWLVPRNEEEAVIVWELSNLAWRRLRLFRAQARREARDLRRMLAETPAPRALSAEETEQRAWLLYAVLSDCERVVKEASRLRFEMEMLLQELVGQRTTEGKAPQGAAGNSEEQKSEDRSQEAEGEEQGEGEIMNSEL